MDLNISISNNPDYVVISINGKIDISYYNVFLKKLNDVLISGKKNIIMDFSAVSFISSIGIGAILEARNYIVKNDGKFIISNLNSKTKHVFELIGVLNYMEVYDNLDEAISRVQPELMVL